MNNPIGDIFEGLGRLINQVGDEPTNLHRDNPKPKVRLFESVDNSKFTITVEWDGSITPEKLDLLGVSAFNAVKGIVDPAPVPTAVPATPTVKE